MTRYRVRQLAGVAIAVAILVAALAGWSQLRLRAMRGEIEELASATLELDTLNRELRDRIDAEAALREKLQSSAEPVDLVPVRPDSSWHAVVYYDRTQNRALLVLETAPPASTRQACRLLIESSDGVVLSLPVDAAASHDDGLLLTDLPEGVKRFVIAVSIADGWHPVMSGRPTTRR